MMARPSQISLASQDVTGGQTGTRAKVDGHEFVVVAKRKHGETLAQMATTSFGVSGDKPRSAAHSCEREERVCACVCELPFLSLFWCVFVSLK